MGDDASALVAAATAGSAPAAGGLTSVEALEFNFKLSCVIQISKKFRCAFIGLCIRCKVLDARV